MGKEVVNQKQAITIMATFIIGSSTILGSGVKAKQDAWLAIIIAMGIFSLVIPIYGRICSIYPGKNIYQVMELLLGKVAGKIISLLFVWYAFFLGALVIRDISEFARTVSLPETPECIFAFFAVLLMILTVRGGVELLARFLGIFFPIYILMILTVTFVSIPFFELKNLKPFLYDGIKPVLGASLEVFSFPFAETVLFVCILEHLRKNGSPYKTYYASMLIGGAILLIISVRSILVLGFPMWQMQNFASYAATRLIRIGDFFQRIEASVAIVFIISGYTKATICLFSACKGIASIFNIKEYKHIAAPIGILMTQLSIIVYDNGAELAEWAATIYPYFAFPFQVIIPLIIWIIAEIKIRMQKASPSQSVEEKSVS